MKRLLRIGLALGGLVAPAAGMTAPPACAAAKPAAAPPGGLRVIEPERSTLGNGLTLLLLPRHGLPLVQMQMMIPAGGRDDPPGREGVAGMTAGLLSKGTTRRDGDHFADEVEFLGGLLAASAGIERSVIAGEFAARDLEKGLALMGEMVRTPAFDP